MKAVERTHGKNTELIVKNRNYPDRIKIIVQFEIGCSIASYCCCLTSFSSLKNVHIIKFRYFFSSTLATVHSWISFQIYDPFSMEKNTFWSPTNQTGLFTKTKQKNK